MIVTKIHTHFRFHYMWRWAICVLKLLTVLQLTQFLTSVPIFFTKTMSSHIKSSLAFILNSFLNCPILSIVIFTIDIIRTFHIIIFNCTYSLLVSRRVIYLCYCVHILHMYDMLDPYLNITLLFGPLRLNVMLQRGLQSAYLDSEISLMPNAEVNST